MNPAWTRGSLFAVNRELPVKEASMPDRLSCSRINEEIHKLTLLRNGECQNDRAYLAMFLLLVVATSRSCMPAATTCTWHRSWELPRSWRIRRTPGVERSC